MIALIALVIRVLFLGINNVECEPVIIYPERPTVMPDSYMPELPEEVEWDLFNLEAYYDYKWEFTAIFEAIEYKRAKNGRSMVKGAYDTSFKFCKKG